MIKFLFDFFTPLFKEELDEFRYQCILENDRAQEQIFYQVNFPIGSKIIHQTKGPYPLLVGEVIDHVYDKESNQLLCKVKDSSGNSHTISGVILNWNEHKEKYLRRLHWWERWSIFNEDSISSEEGNSQTEELRLKEQNN